MQTYRFDCIIYVTGSPCIEFKWHFSLFSSIKTTKSYFETPASIKGKSRHSQIKGSIIWAFEVFYVKKISKLNFYVIQFLFHLFMYLIEYGYTYSSGHLQQLLPPTTPQYCIAFSQSLSQYIAILMRTWLRLWSRRLSL